MRRFIVGCALLLAAFMLGFVPMWLKSLASSSILFGAARRLGLATMESTLASAVIDAKRGHYELARLAASSFFTSARVETGMASDSIFSWEQRERVQSLLAGEDNLITLLARGDPVSSDRLSDLYVSYRGILSQ
jgi:hypothetical protein